MRLGQSTANLMELISHEAVVIDLELQVVTDMNVSFEKTFGISIGTPLQELNTMFSEVLSSNHTTKDLQMELEEYGTSSWKQMSMRTAHKGIRNYDLRVGYVDDTHHQVYLIFSQSAYDLEQMELQNGYYEIISTASFSYPFFLDVKAKRIEFFGPILEQFKLPAIMDNFPEPVIAGGMILEEDLPGYLAMVERMYKGEPPQGSFRTYTPTGEILCYSVNYTVKRDPSGAPTEVIGDFINRRENSAEVPQKEIARPHESENKILVHQIKAHFFFNTLSTISALCKQDAAKADIAIKTFAAYMRSYMYLITEEENIPFDQELGLVRSSLEIEQMRFPDSFTYVLDLKYRDFEVPPLCLQPIVENALLHGLRKTGRHGQLKLSTEKKGNMAYIYIIDDGNGFDTSILEQSTSIGLKNLIQRVKLMANGTVSIRSAHDQGTQVVIAIPVQENR